MPGILAIWNDVEPAFVETYERWLVSEHIPERLAVPGFLEARRYEALRGTPRFFTPYVVSSPEVLTSPEYLARLATPTPLTREVMTGFRGMARTVCSLVYHSTVDAIGGFAVTACAAQPAVLDADALLEVAAASRRDPRIVGVQLWRAVRAPGQAVSSEARLRPGGDRSVEAALVAEVMREADALALQDSVGAAMRQSVRPGASGESAAVQTAVYRFLGLWRARGAHSQGVGE